jgi:hypothetical protein
MINYYNRILVVLYRLKEKFPEYSMSQHLSDILEGDMTDHEFLIHLQQYKQRLETTYINGN